MAGHQGDAALARRGLADPDPGVRVAALGALARLAKLTAGDVESALGEPEPAVRRRVVEVALDARGTGTRSSLPAPSWPRWTIPTHSSWSARPGTWPSAGPGRR